MSECTNRPIRVLVLLTNLSVTNGVSSFIMNYYRKLHRSEVEMDFAVLYDRPSSYIQEIEANCGRVYVLPPVKKVTQHFAECVRILDQGKYDVVHDNSLILTLPMMLCAAMKKVPVRILHSHNSKMGETRFKKIRNNAVLPILRATATDYAACSKLAGEAMFGKRQFTVIPNVIEAERYQYNEQRRNEVRKMMSVEDRFVVGTVGRVAYQKNPFFAVDVFEEVLKRCPNAEYWWVGSGPLQQELAEYVEKKGLSQYVKLLGSREDVVDLYQAMDCFFLPSLFEGLPVTGVEAQAMGLPCVISNTVTDELVYSDLVRFVSLDDDREKWAEQIVKCEGQNRACDRLRECVFSDLGCGKRLMSIYRSMTNKA